LNKKIIQPFQFKEFSVQQEKCSMKVGTDGVLLGAWVDLENCKHALDIGTGSGLIALMIAQRNMTLDAIAIDIDKKSFEQATENFKATNWSERLRAVNASLQNFISPIKFDLIVSNPPFFNKSLKSETEQKNLARHVDTLSFNKIANFAKDNLSQGGKLAVIYPAEEENKCNNVANKFNFFISRVCYVKPLPNKIPKRVLLEYTFENKPPIITELIIELGQRHEYSNEYKELTKEFYLGF
jgi:tRNA1Val (adenine37-N6)-methyltransferase